MAREPSPLSGIINLYKPSGISSASALYRVRRIIGQRKSGHAGTLDPLADGVLVLCLGKATKLVERVMDHPKVYRAKARLDCTSESLDVDSPLQPVPIPAMPSREGILDQCQRWEGPVQQVPPLISALKIKGVPAYKRTRRNENITLAARPVRIYWIHLHAYAWPEIDLEICSGRGTYVRSLVRDIGSGLGIGGCLTALTRTRVGPFSAEDAVTIDELAAATDPTSRIENLEHARAMLDPETIAIPPRPQRT